MSKNLDPVLVTRRVKVTLRCDDDSLTKQEFLPDTDVKTLMDRFMQTGQRQVAVEPTYGDATVFPESFQDAMEIVAQTHEAFDALPSQLRNFFENDPSNYLRALQSEEGRQAITDHGVDLPDIFAAQAVEGSEMPFPQSDPPAKPIVPLAEPATPKEGG